MGRTLKFKSTCHIAQALETTSEHISQLQQIAQHPVSLQAPVGEEHEADLGDFIKVNQRLLS